jgi:membrane protease YdiL (CAAX protease family)
MLKNMALAKKKLYLKDGLVLALVSLLLILTPINTDITLLHMLWMSLTLGLAVVLPYLFYRNDTKARVYFHFSLKSGWTNQKIAYICFAVAVTYFIFPFYFATTGAYAHWPSPHNGFELILLFIGTNALGIWDELFFINTLLHIFRRYLSFRYANALQAFLWTLFLYELGFTHWMPLLILPFALLQGYTYKKYQSLGFIIAIHLAIDFVLFLAILSAHGLLPFKLFLM